MGGVFFEFLWVLEYRFFKLLVGISWVYELFFFEFYKLFEMFM